MSIAFGILRSLYEAEPSAINNMPSYVVNKRQAIDMTTNIQLPPPRVLYMYGRVHGATSQYFQIFLPNHF